MRIVCPALVLALAACTAPDSAVLEPEPDAPSPTARVATPTASPVIERRAPRTVARAATPTTSVEPRLAMPITGVDAPLPIPTASTGTSPGADRPTVPAKRPTGPVHTVHLSITGMT